MIELEVDEIGPSLRYATAKINRATRTTAPGDRPAVGSNQDPWPAPPPAGSDYPDEPPF